MRSRVNGTLKIHSSLPLTAGQRLVAELVLTACADTACLLEVSSLAAVSELSVSSVYRILDALGHLGVIVRRRGVFSTGAEVRFSRPASNPQRIRSLLKAQESPMTDTDLDFDALFEGLTPAPVPAKVSKPRVLQPFQEFGALYIAMRESVIHRKLNPTERGRAFANAKHLLLKFTIEELKSYWTFAEANLPDKLSEATFLSWLNPSIELYVLALREENATQQRRATDQQQRQDAVKAEAARREAEFAVQYGAETYEEAVRRSRLLTDLRVPLTFQDAVKFRMRSRPEERPDAEWVLRLAQQTDVPLWPELRRVCGLPQEEAPTLDELAAYIAMKKAKREGSTL